MPQQGYGRLADAGRTQEGALGLARQPFLTAGAVAILLVATVGVYLNSLGNPFLFDDLPLIRDNPDLHQHWRPWQIIFTLTYRTRPVFGLSLGLNYGIGGRDVRGYHVVNIAVHFLAALTLFGVVRRTLRLERLREQFAGAADWLALAVALLWTVHPLQTQSVTYIVQRCESLMGLFYLLTLYAVIRGAGCRHGRRWYGAAVVACALGMGTKQVMVTAPFVALLYDRTLVAGSFREAVRRRWSLYVGLAATWGVLGPTFYGAGYLDWIARELLMGRLGFVQSPMPTPWEYARSQFGVLTHYLWLIVWPSGLCLDYAWPVATTVRQVLPPAILVVVLMALTIWGVARRRAAGLAGASAFAILAPTSSVMPIQDLASEHRMYLPLAAVTAIVVAGGFLAGGRLLRYLVASDDHRNTVGIVLSLVLVATVAGILGYGTICRNADYASDLALWSDIVAKRPGNSRAHYTLGNALARQGHVVEAILHYREALRLNPNYADAHNNLGNALMKEDRWDEAIGEYREAIRADPGSHDAHNNLGAILAMQGKKDEAAACFREALRLKPDFGEALSNLARLSAQSGGRPFSGDKPLPEARPP